MGHFGTQMYQVHPARINQRERPPHRWDNHFSSNRPHTNIATAPRRPYPISWDWGLRRKANLSRPRQLGRPLASISNQENGTRTLQPRKPGVNFVRIQWSRNNLSWRRCATSPSRPGHSQRTIFSGGRFIPLQRHFGMYLVALHEGYPFHVPSDGELPHQRRID